MMYRVNEFPQNCLEDNVHAGSAVLSKECGEIYHEGKPLLEQHE